MYQFYMWNGAVRDAVSVISTCHMFAQGMQYVSSVLGMRNLSYPYYWFLFNVYLKGQINVSK